jgi:hypothetical protein
MSSCWLCVNLYVNTACYKDKNITEGSCGLIDDQNRKSISPAVNAIIAIKGGGREVGQCANNAANKGLFYASMNLFPQNRRFPR